ncbi:hypothetical protein AB0M39_21285 [Streptomyces sp. NPDC051907]|uniref:hypothetical protein n=1 Tax=Streptomyces sp. NPDC051907 TaxID=3155284 RepID=UPI00342FE7AD
MSDHELKSAIRELAASGETPPAVSGAQVRRRAEARGRRRRVVGAGVATVVVLSGVVFGLPRVLGSQDEGRLPAAPPTTGVEPAPSVPAPPPFTLDTGKRMLTVSRDGLPVRTIEVEFDGVAEGRLTVAAKSPKRKVPTDRYDMSKDEVTRNWVVELSRSNGGTVYVYESGENAIDLNAIAVPAADAQWLYDNFKVGDTVAVS